MAVYSSFQKCLNKDFHTFIMYCCAQPTPSLLWLPLPCQHEFSIYVHVGGREQKLNIYYDFRRICTLVMSIIWNLKFCIFLKNLISFWIWIEKKIYHLWLNFRIVPSKKWCRECKAAVAIYYISLWGWKLNYFFATPIHPPVLVMYV